MRRTLPLIVIASLLGAACGSDTATSTQTTDSVLATVPGDSNATTLPELDVAPTSTSPDKPTDIAVPGEAPAELVVSVLEEGDGPASEVDDTVIVDYVGVRSLDGVEFDNSYDRGKAFAVGPLGSAQVIQGWNDGLIGAQAGERLQLDVPSADAYGADARSDVIRENEPLTFVIDVRTVIKAPDPANAPTESGVDPSEGATEMSFEDLVDGDGPVLEDGQNALFHLVLFRADNGVQLESTWAPAMIDVPMAPDGFPALVQGMPGMKVGGRRAITVPPALAFGDAGNPQIGLPAGTDVVFVIDLFGVY